MTTPSPSRPSRPAGPDEPLAPNEDFTAYAKQFEAMDRDQLLGEARRWCMSAIVARDWQHRVLCGTDALLTDAQHAVSRCWLLLHGAGKTVKADALRAALLQGRP